MLFEVMLGLKVNFHKSMLTRVNDTNAWLNEATLVKNCKTFVLPFTIGGDHRQLHFWYSLLDRIQRRLLGWKSRQLSLGGRLVLLKFVLYSLVYSLILQGSQKYCLLY